MGAQIVLSAVKETRTTITTYRTDGTVMSVNTEDIRIVTASVVGADPLRKSYGGKRQWQPQRIRGEYRRVNMGQWRYDTSPKVHGVFLKKDGTLGQQETEDYLWSHDDSQPDWVDEFLSANTPQG